MSSQTQIFAAIQEDAEECYSVILLYSSFFKDLPFHVWLYSQPLRSDNCVTSFGGFWPRLF